MNNERIAILITLTCIAAQSGLYLLTGGFAAGTKLHQIESEVKLIRQEVVAANKIQDFRLDRLEAAAVK
ncbi:hypothetical protein A0J48_016120 [Sphaerospermopsis aphanizomenoides BCCUSP55]|uniref:hypothetical protein n=1 Tax=Sphaerospermopsis aphanizomenoides TaxID=459663 RepID=UPI0019039F3D|nr:hypothetical protein [Sphaerospermopsis aphanizomenoides]MBK1987313.1 hypothetical protein [Sphaerospermopsis aphanizomenoides BCCUSP55]MBK1989047.1 hypothetical protein [Sphaerospermopsis aphanizomenoides BCCUSP55]